MRLRLPSTDAEFACGVDDNAVGKRVRVGIQVTDGYAGMKSKMRVAVCRGCC